MAQREDVNPAVAFVRERPLAVVFVVLALVLGVDLIRKLAMGTLPVGDLATHLWDGTVRGLSLGLAGIGLAMTYSILNFANFAHGDFMTTGAFVGWVTAFLIAGFGDFATEALFFLGGPLPINTGTLGISITSTPIAIVVGLLVAAVAAAGLARLVDRIVFKPMRGQGGISLLIASVGVALVVRHLLLFVFQGSSRGLTATQQTPSYTLALGDGSVTITAHEVTLIVLAAGLMLATHLLLRYTKLGTAMRAMADNEDLAQVTGIPTERIIRATWLLGGGLTGASGYLIALEQGTLTTTLGWGLLLLIFAAVILGGIGSVYGAMAGGLVIGIAETLSQVWIPQSLTLAAVFLVMIAMLLVRPKGLLGGVATV
ncbi:MULTISPECIES: branched-chain amino acid ABC transporter permease [Salinibaculum]|uniref:branched-chain amino acid ABC transporter permease n=1 Tax=Salinibaculum TaxID=2732368 RepID=UPI0030D10AC8